MSIIRKAFIGWVSNVGELRNILKPFTDECEIDTVLQVSYCLRDSKEGILRIEIEDSDEKEGT